MKLTFALSCTAGLLAQDPQPAAPSRSVMLLPQAVVLPRGDTRIAIDGTLTDWPELPALRLDDQRQLSGTALNAWRGPNDLSAVAFLMWDSDNLYFACAVKDEWHRALDANSLTLSEIPVADSVVLTFDPDRNTRNNGPDPGRREDREYWLADEVSRELVQWDRLRGSARVLDHKEARVVVLHNKEQGITNYEARIPWVEILPVGRKAEAGLVMDMQIVVNDFDELTDPMPQTRIGWTFGCSPSVDPGLLGSIMLVADRDALQGRVPEFPPKPGTAVPAAEPESYWNELTARLIGLPPAIHDGTNPPELAGGARRWKLLEEIDGHCAQFPRVDSIELHHRIHRRMTREVAGLMARGLPWWWSNRLRAVSKNAEDPVPNQAVRLFRLPMGGWLVATPGGGFCVDVVGNDLPELLWGRNEFSLLTQPLDMTRRNDQLLVRMFLNKPPRPVLAHIAFHLPVMQMADMPLVEPGTKFGPPNGPQFQSFGQKLADGSVEWSCSYAVQVPNGPRLVWIGPTLHPDQAPEGRFDAVIASPLNANLPAILGKFDPGLVIIDDGFLCQVLPNVPRMSLRDLHNLQKVLQPLPSLLLAPGESWDIALPR